MAAHATRRFQTIFHGVDGFSMHGRGFVSIIAGEETFDEREHGQQAGTRESEHAASMFCIFSSHNAMATARCATQTSSSGLGAHVKKTGGPFHFVVTAHG